MERLFHHHAKVAAPPAVAGTASIDPPEVAAAIAIPSSVEPSILSEVVHELLTIDGAVVKVVPYIVKDINLLLPILSLLGVDPAKALEEFLALVIKQAL
jgi:hypothetical protein